MTDQIPAAPNLDDWLTAAEAAERIGVKRDTVYAYVSRGFVQSRRSDDDGRGRVLNPVDVERLARRSRGANKRQQTGRPESAITLVEDDELYYRGRPAAELAASHTFEQVADLLWGAEDSPGDWEPSRITVDVYTKVVEAMPPTALTVDQMRIVSACLTAFDPPEPAMSSRLLMSTAKRVLTTMVAALPQRSDVTQAGMPALLWSRLCDRPPTAAELQMVSGAMIVLADHDLASSTRAVRSAAVGGLDASALIRLGMDSGSGVVKGVASLAVESFLHNLTSADTVGLALHRRLKQGEPIPGFGHPVYTRADRRAERILAFVREAAADRERLAVVEEVLNLQLDRGVPPPNAGFALAAMTYVAGLISGAGETIFVVSRSVGWVAHAIEALDSDPTERMASTYVGPLPGRH